jgi:hypothetical protein
MNTRHLKFLALIGSISLLSACAVAPSFSDMSNAYQTEVEKYSNNNLLLNVVRASKRMPLSFLDIPSVLGSGTIGTGMSWSESWTSAGFLGAATAGVMSTLNPTMSTSRGFNFTQSSLSNAEFTKGFVSPINMANVSFFMAGRTSKHLLFNLFVESLSFQRDGKQITLINDPYSSNYHDFTKAMTLLVDLGLTTEMVQKMNMVGPAMDQDTLIGKNILATFITAPNKGGTILSKEENGKTVYQYAVPEVSYRFCFNPVVDKEKVTQRFGASFLCNTMARSGDNMPKLVSEQKLADKATTKSSVTATQKADPKAKTDTIDQFSLQIRSPQEVFSYLGVVTNYQLRNEYKVFVTVPSNWGDFTGQKSENRPLPILMINAPTSIGRIATVNYEDQNYFVPQVDNGYSSDTMNVLAQLVSICKIAGSIPPSPAVLVK